jgi:hypothetical protein
VNNLPETDLEFYSWLEARMLEWGITAEMSKRDPSLLSEMTADFAEMFFAIRMLRAQLQKKNLMELSRMRAAQDFEAGCG